MLPLSLRKANDWMNEVPTMFNELWNGTNVGKFSNNTPMVNIREDKDSYNVELAAPGMTKDDLKITLGDSNTLNVSMQKKEQHNEGKENSRYYRHEFSYTNFSQSFALPEDCNVDGIKAKAENGVVEINIPKVCKECKCNCRRIEIE